MGLENIESDGFITTSVNALVNWARFVLARQSPDVIAIAGGVGKTSTEEAVVRVLSPSESGDEGVFQNGNLNDLFIR